jgi:hypothetical protein
MISSDKFIVERINITNIKLLIYFKIKKSTIKLMIMDSFLI